MAAIEPIMELEINLGLEEEIRKASLSKLLLK